MNLFDFVKSQGYSFSPTSKAAKILAAGYQSNDVELARAISTTKAFNEDQTLRTKCIEIVENNGKVQREAVNKEPKKSYTNRKAEPER